CTINNDPIEKKPFSHVYPGTKALSISTGCCNLSCKFCQNWQISQVKPEDLQAHPHTPAEIVALATKMKSRSVAYTYSEPTIFTEYLLDCARAAKDAGLGNVVISNGFINEQPLKEWCSVVSAVKIDFKAFTEKFYEEVCLGQMQPVLDTLKRLKGSGVWFEMVTLTIPTLNDSADDVKKMAAWIVKELGPDVPLHFTAFHPDYKLRNLPNTPEKTLIQARDLAMAEGCNFVYVGNVPGSTGANTYCPKCKTTVVERYNYVVKSSLQEGKCPKCATPIPGLWK
ncbi:MAG: AmmeMemoRadiSam system radical SAM enzyme, partial [Verrucomicrobia bacterium]|nr:AmmeMemoRadiSam system radical SAM enzyme [Verrucomicrobiota bacterium]